MTLSKIINAINEWNRTKGNLKLSKLDVLEIATEIKRGENK